MTHKFKHPGYFEAVRWDGTEETHKYIRGLIGKALLHSTTVSNHDKSFLIRVASDDEGTTRVYNGNWIMKWFDGTLAVRTDDDFRSWLGKLVQPMDENGWFYRKDAAMPYQTWCPFADKEALVEVRNRDETYFTTGLVKDLWWGYESDMISSAVIHSARLARKDDAEKSKITPTDALRRQVRLRKDIMEAQDLIVEEDGDVTIEVFHNGNRKIIQVPEPHREEVAKLLADIAYYAREEFIKEYVDV